MLCTLLVLPAPSQTARRTQATSATPKTPAAHAALWKQVATTASAPPLVPITLSPDQTEAIQALLLNRAEADGWGCEDDIPPQDWLKDLTYAKIALTPTTTTIFVQAGKACGRSGKDGINGAMWIVTFTANGTPMLLATPQESFNGALYSIQPTRASGFPDLIVTWKLETSPTDSELTYFRFDGKLYQPISAATLSTTGTPNITPIPIPAE